MKLCITYKIIRFLIFSIRVHLFKKQLESINKTIEYTTSILLKLLKNP